MKKLILFLWVSIAGANEYLNLVNCTGPLGDFSKGEIEILTDPALIGECMKKTGRDVGVIARDNYWIWLNDAVRFPSGALGVYGRILWTKSLSGVPGVAVLPRLPDGRFVLNVNFRHATRSWEIELPRGGINQGESPQAAAQREALEETGCQVGELTSLGEMAVDSGLTNSIIPVFLADVISRENSRPEESEAILGYLYLTADEIKKGLRQGFLIVNDQKVPLRDPFLAFAFLQLTLRLQQQR